MEILPISLMYEYTCPEQLKDNVTKSIRHFYLNNKKVDQSTKWKLIDVKQFFFIIRKNNLLLLFV